jgi:two-component system response regulator NreC
VTDDLGTAGDGIEPALDVTVVLVDGQAVVREGLRLLIEQSEHHSVVADVGTIDEALDLGVQPTVVVTDADFPDGSGRQAISSLRRHFNDSAILVLSPVQHPARIQPIISAGARGYLLRSAKPDELAHAIQAVARGDTYLQPTLGIALAQWNNDGGADGGPYVRLSEKECEVLLLIALGYKNSEIAEQLSVSLRTVETHRARLSQKLGRRNRSELVRYAIDAGIVRTR